MNNYRAKENGQPGLGVMKIRNRCQSVVTAIGTDVAKRGLDHISLSRVSINPTFTGNPAYSSVRESIFNLNQISKTEGAWP